MGTMSHHHLLDVNDEEAEGSSSEGISTDKKPRSAIKKEVLFPFKLYDLLQKSTEDGFEDIVSWLPCGTMFRIHNQKRFEAEIMPNFFPGMTHYKSFRRQLNLYGINQWETKRVQQEKKVLGGSGSYAHSFLIRNHRELCCKIERDYQRLKPVLPEASRMISAMRSPLAQSSTTASQDVLSYNYYAIMAMMMYGFHNGEEKGYTSMEENQRGHELQPESSSRALSAAGFQLSPTMSTFGIVDSRQQEHQEVNQQTTSSTTTTTTTNTTTKTNPFLSSSYESLTKRGISCFSGNSNTVDAGSGERISERNEAVLQRRVEYDPCDLNMAEEPLLAMMISPGIPFVCMNQKKKPSQQEINDEIIKTFMKQY